MNGTKSDGSKPRFGGIVINSGYNFRNHLRNTFKLNGNPSAVEAHYAWNLWLGRTFFVTDINDKPDPAVLERDQTQQTTEFFPK